MSAFRVGQRVRLKYCRVAAWKFLEGREGSVLAAGQFSAGATYALPGNYLVQMDGFIAGPGQFVADQLEPILPEGAAPSTWAECVWQPEHLRATA